MKKLISNLLIFTGIVVCMLVLSYCSKDNDMIRTADGTALKAGGPQPTMGGVFTNHKMKVASATDDGADITVSFSPYTFLLATGGVAKVWNDLLAQEGTWSMNGRQITFSFPTSVFPEMAFLNKTWTIVSDGSGGVMALRAANGENDTVTFVMSE